MLLEKEKMCDYAQKIFETAKSHGWHEERLSDISYIGLAMTEVCEAINADRKGRYSAPIDNLPEDDEKFKAFYELNVKDTVETEIADTVIRLIDYAYLRWGDEMAWYYYPTNTPYKEDTFLVNAYYLMKVVMGEKQNEVIESISYCYEWAKMLNFDLDAHILCKMRFNKLRPYRHGGKKY